MHPAWKAKITVNIGIKRFIDRLALMLALLGTACSPANVVSQQVLTGGALLKTLQSGGNNIYFRHAQTDWSQSDHIERAGDWTSCDASRVRQLSDEGRRTAKAVGAHMRTLRIPVSKVLASPYCRTVETAELLDLGAVGTTTDIMNLRVAEYFGGREAILKRARLRLAMTPPPGSNIVLVAHGNVARDATDVYPGEAEAVVFRARGDGDFTFIGRLTPEQWAELARPN